MKYVDRKSVENFSEIVDMKKQAPRRVFSEIFKREKVRLLEMGKLSVSGLSRMYNISETSIYKWKKKYSTYPAEDRIVVETESDYLQALQMNKRIADLERLLGSQQLKLDYFQRVLTHASEHYKEDVEKKFGE
ncbi:MAG: transposase [Saprospiraceae bacterium]